MPREVVVSAAPLSPPPSIKHRPSPPPPPDGPVDHAAIKAYFSKDVWGFSGLSENPWLSGLVAIHKANPYGWIVIGRARWSYLPKATIIQIEDLFDLYPENRPGERNESPVCFVHYPPDVGDEPHYLATEAISETFLFWLSKEWPYATAEQQELARAMIKQILADGFEVDLKWLAFADLKE